MYKNKKGFTLVELLAAIVILGILSVFAIPMITGMVENSRNKMYVDDALKLIARAEYQMKASSNTIDKPDSGDCIIISMAYLQANEIVTAPNGGEYDKDQSYVVIKNSGNGKLEYAATIIEKMKKGGYKGIKLTPYKNLLSSNAAKYVVPIEDDELVEDIENIKTAYLKNELGDGYIPGKLIAIYHYHEVKDASIQTVTSSDPYFVGEIDSNRNELKARLTFKVNDEDTARSDLKVYYSAVEKNYTTAHSYGNNPVYTIEIDFADEPYHYSHDQARDIPIYIKVADPEGNYVEKVHHYNIYSNVAPTINESDTFVTKRQSDMIALLDASVTLVVDDDLDEPEDLLICAKDTSSPEGADSCSNFSKYSGGTTKKFDYHFYCGGTCTRDGEVHYLTIFVRDSLGAESKVTKPYTFSKNTIPNIVGNIDVSSDTETYPSEGNKKVHVRVKAEDDYTNLNQLKVYISEDNANWREYNYSDDTNQNNFLFELSGRYDGQPRTIYVKVKDHENLYSEVKTANYTVYHYTGPEISHFMITSNGQACNKGNICALEDSGTKNGSLNAFIELGVVDYLEAESDYSNIRVCVSEVEADCSNDANFDPYSKYNDKQVSKTFDGSYDGSTKRMYAVVKDNEGHSDSATATYVLYKDSKPQVLDFDLTPVSGNFPDNAGFSNIAYLNITAIDDFTDDEHLLFTLKKNGNVVLQNIPLSNLYEKHATGEVGEDGQPLYEYIYNYEVQVSNTYDGETYHFEVTVKDNKNMVSDAKTFDYKVFLNTCPQIDGSPRVVFASNNYGVNSNFLDLYFYPRFRDDVDPQLKVMYCYKIGTANPVCMDPVYTDKVYHLTKDNLFTGLDYNGQTIKVYAIGLDSLDPDCAVTTEEYSFRIHNKVGKPEILYSAATYVPSSHETPEPDPDNPDEPVEPVVDTGPHDLTVYFQIRDLFDKYQVCMSKENNGSQCTNFVGPDGTSSTTFDGTDLLTHSLHYSYEGEITSTTNLYLFTKGMADTATTNYTKATIPITPAGACTAKDASHPYYEYTYAGNAGGKISTSACNHKCYHYNFMTNETVPFSNNYNVKIKYRDITNPVGSFCSNFEENRTAVPMYCDFKDCFYNDVDNNYEQNAIGIVPFDDAVPWTEEVGDLILVNYSHYNLYRSSYTEGNQNITLTRQDAFISPYGLDNNLYTDFTYVRVADY